jgi:hypothetical protein
LGYWLHGMAGRLEEMTCVNSRRIRRSLARVERVAAGPHNLIGSPTKTLHSKNIS